MPNLNLGLFSAIFCVLCSGAAFADIDIFQTGSGWQVQDSNGSVIGTATTRQGAQRVADVYTRQGQQVNWRTSMPTTTGSGGNISTSTQRQLGTSQVPPARQLTSGSSVGGLVVNKLVKDHHVETGFEEIVCVIDGEQIASYDEEFVISGAVNKAGCIGNNASYGNTYVWASRTSGGTNYSTMIEDVNNPGNNACWIRVDIGTTNNKIKVSDIPSRWFMVGQQVNCGSWADYDTLHERVLDARKSGRTWATVGGAVGGAGLGVGIMELFGNRLIGGKVMGQKSLDEVELLYSQMTTTERAQYEETITELGRACDELHALGGVHSACGD